MACKHGNKKIVELLMKKKADINAKTRVKQTPLMMAAQRGFIDIVQLLLDYKAKLEIRNIQNFTAIHLTILNYFTTPHDETIEIACILLLNGSELQFESSAVNFFLFYYLQFFFKSGIGNFLKHYQTTGRIFYFNIWFQYFFFPEKLNLNIF